MVTAKVSGIDVPLYLGMKAVNAITIEYGSLRGLMETLSSDNIAAQNEATFFVAYQLSLNAALILKQNAPFDNADEMEAACRSYEYYPLFAEVSKAIREGTETTIDAEIIGDSKNVEATQGTK